MRQPACRKEWSTHEAFLISPSIHFAIHLMEGERATTRKEEATMHVKQRWQAEDVASPVMRRKD
jgi:hypothetical protein